MFPPSLIYSAVIVTVHVAIIEPSSVVNVILAVPATTAVTFPFLSTVAIEVLSLAHLPALLSASAGVTDAINVSLAPIFKLKVFLLSLTPVTLLGLM